MKTNQFVLKEAGTELKIALLKANDFGIQLTIKTERIEAQNRVSNNRSVFL